MLAYINLGLYICYIYKITCKVSKFDFEVIYMQCLHVCVYKHKHKCISYTLYVTLQFVLSVDLFAQLESFITSVWSDDFALYIYSLIDRLWMIIKSSANIDSGVKKKHQWKLFLRQSIWFFDWGINIWVFFLGFF